MGATVWVEKDRKSFSMLFFYKYFIFLVNILKFYWFKEYAHQISKKYWNITILCQKLGRLKRCGRKKNPHPNLSKTQGPIKSVLSEIYAFQKSVLCSIIRKRGLVILKLLKKPEIYFGNRRCETLTLLGYIIYIYIYTKHSATSLRDL